LRQLNHLNRLYRFTGQSLLWIAFGFCAALVGLLVVPLISLLASERALRQHRTRSTIAVCFRWFVAVACQLRIVSCRVTGIGHYDPGASQLILANHPSLIDVVILISLFPQADCVIKEAVTRNLLMRPSVRIANYIPNLDPALVLASCVDRLRSGNSLVLFPEGTRSDPDTPLKFKPGAAEIALRAEAAILPVVIDCKPTFLSKRDPWYRVPSRMPHFEIRVLPPLRPGDLVEDVARRRRARLSLNASLERLFESALA
jgi:1-acyl-sn-glycerol-3-phosphate acyltransferase